VNQLRKAVTAYADEVMPLASATTTNEQTFYPAIRTLLVAVLKSLGLPSDVRTNTSERRIGTGVDMPDVALYDGGGDFVIVCGEVKTPTPDLEEMADSTARNDQIGRYLARTGVVILSNVRGFGLLTVEPGYVGAGPVPREKRRLDQIVELWPSSSALRSGKAVDASAAEALSELVEIAVTRYAPIAEPETLARVLARQARRAKAGLPEEFSEAVRYLSEDFGSALGISFEGEEGKEFFRSSLVQTVFYGLFAGWCLWWREGAKGTFEWRDLPDYLKIPFLGELYHEIRNPRRIRELGLSPKLDAATETLARVNRDLFFNRLRMPSLGAGKDAERDVATAIVYFYEPFLETFDPDLRKELGVWYTPPEIVRYQVRRVDALIRKELGRPLGFADPEVVVLDPCCGTGAYLIEVLQCIAETLRAEGVQAELGETLLATICERVLGFELLTAPFVIAHLQLHLILADLGVTPEADQRPGVFLTNALTGWETKEQLGFHFPELRAERDASQAVKTDAQIIVVLGNPPYNRFVGAPIEEERSLIDPYKGIKRKENGKQDGPTALFTTWKIRKHLLDDLYIRFFRLAEERIGLRDHYGIVSFISNSSFLAGRSHPIMRESLVNSFQDIWVDNLNGDKYKTGKVIPRGLPGEGTADQSIFTTDIDSRGIQVGVSITTMLKRRGERSKGTKIRYRDFWGKAADKRAALLASLDTRKLRGKQAEEASSTPAGPRVYQDFATSADRRWKLVPYDAVGGYEDWCSLEEIFPTRYQGVNPNRGLEGSVVEIDRKVLAERMRDYFSAMSFVDFKQRHPVICETRADYDPAEMRKFLNGETTYSESSIVPYVVFPFDVRHLYYETAGQLLNRRRPELWENVEDNEFLIAVPEPRKVSESRPLFVRNLFDLHLQDRGSVGFPAQVKQEVEAGDLFNGGRRTSRPPRANLDENVWNTLKKSLKLKDGLEGQPACDLVRRLLKVCLAICHAPDYQEEHRESLAQDWAHVPIPKDAKLLKEIDEAGRIVATLLDPFADAREAIRSVIPNPETLAVLTKTNGKPVQRRELVITIPHFGGARGGWRERPNVDPATALEEKTGDLYISKDVFFSNVPEGVWRYELGGYPVLKKWLGYRDAKRRAAEPLTLAEKDSFRGMVQRISALIALYPRLNRLYGLASTNAWTRQELGLE
jgi:hypothetical protein